LEDATQERLLRPSALDNEEIKSSKDILNEIVLKLEEINSTNPNQIDQIREEQRKETQVFNNNNQSEVFKLDVEAEKFTDVTKMCSFKTGKKRTYQESTLTDAP
jgi:hypothetical protein